MIFLGADHAGFELKEKIKHWLMTRGESVNDFGTNSTDSVDYPDYAAEVARAVNDLNGKGILFCRSGQGMAIAANKIAGVRAAVVWDPVIAKETREDNDSNILVLPAGYIDEKTAQAIVQTWLSTPFSSAERHLNRIKKISALEK